jgi:hypothetical protein
MSIKTIVIFSAFYFYASDIGISFIPFIACADWFVIDDSARGVVSASARVITDGVNARIGLSAIVICGAACKDRGQGSAAGIFVANISIGTCTNHCSNWQ